MTKRKPHTETPEQAEERRRKAREYMREYYQKNQAYAERSRKRAREWNQNHRDRANARSRVSHQRKKATFTAEQWAAHRARSNERTKKWQAKNKEHTAQYAKERVAARMEWYKRIKTERGCRECGNTDWRCLQFHHRNPEEKEFALSQARSFSQAKLEAEVAKCDVLCANCHAIHHWQERAY